MQTRLINRMLDLRRVVRRTQFAADGTRIENVPTFTAGCRARGRRGPADMCAQSTCMLSFTGHRPRCVIISAFSQTYRYGTTPSHTLLSTRHNSSCGMRPTGKCGATPPSRSLLYMHYIASASFCCCARLPAAPQNLHAKLKQQTGFRQMWNFNQDGRSASEFVENSEAHLGAASSPGSGRRTGCDPFILS